MAFNPLRRRPVDQYDPEFERGDDDTNDPGFERGGWATGDQGFQQDVASLGVRSPSRQSTAQLNTTARAKGDPYSPPWRSAAEIAGDYAPKGSPIGGLLSGINAAAAYSRTSDPYVSAIENMAPVRPVFNWLTTDPAANQSGFPDVVPHSGKPATPKPESGSPSAQPAGYSDEGAAPSESTINRIAYPGPSHGEIAPSGRTRAIKMPDGKILFTNDDSYGGDEYSNTAEAGRDIRNRQRNDPGFAVMNALMQSSMRATQGESRAPAKTTQVAGNTTVKPGGFSTFQPGGLDVNKLGEAAGLAALARYQAEQSQQEQRARMTPEQIAELQDRNLHADRWRTGSWQRSSDENQRAKKEDIATAMATIPPGPKLDAAIAKIEKYRYDEEERFARMFGAKPRSQADVNAAADAYPVQPTQP